VTPNASRPSPHELTGLDFSSTFSPSYNIKDTMPAQKLAKLDFPEKLIQSGKKENTEAVLKRIKVRKY
jgi:hypothetical protein